MLRMILAVVFLSCLAQQVEADEYSNSVSLGAYLYAFNSSSKDLIGPETPPGIRVAERNADTVALLYTRMLTPDWSLTLALGVPPDFTLDGKDVAAPLGHLVDLRSLSPAFIAQHHWHFEDGKIEPFVGLGIDYNHFYRLRATQTLNGALGGSTSISVNDVLSPLVTAGANVNITERTFVTLAASYVGLAASPRLTTDGTTRSIPLELSPVIYRLTVGYRF